MAQLFHLSYWFNQSPTALSPLFGYGFFVLFALLAILAALLRILSKRSLRDALDKQIFRKSGNVLAWLSVFGFVWLFCVSQEVQFFGMRAWFLLIVAIGIGAAISIFRFARITAPQMRMKKQSQADVNKYLPRRSR